MVVCLTLEQTSQGKKIYNVKQVKSEVCGRLYVAYADDYEEVPEISAGNIAAVTGLKANKSNFSIDHILNVAGEKQNLQSFQYSKEVLDENKKFAWLNCTRYRPPKLPRQRKKEGIQRRKLGRNPRIPFSSSQVAFLEAKFLRTPYLSSSDVTHLASYLKLSETRVKIWFQNRRARERREKERQTKAQKKVPEIKFHSKSTAIVPLCFPKCFPFDYNSFGCITCSEPNNYFRVIAPLDLSERQMVTHII